ncbi:MAG: hypothetical protein UV63_C0007G0020 [Microgenomates group bacterium GW2011_GWC1_43_11]|nr:MAG: hypothetical protein UV63_C0007G0020 [Microgenomates group bacterium GW2011_GWC1_43_11]
MDIADKERIEKEILHQIHHNAGNHHDNTSNEDEKHKKSMDFFCSKVHSCIFHTVIIPIS